MNTKNLVTLQEFADLTGQPIARISQLCAEPKIEIVMWGNRKHIDISKFPPSNYMKQTRT